MNMDIVNRVAVLVYKIEDAEKFILLTQDRPGFWTLPGGGFEPQDKDIIGTLHRELTEELSLEFDQYSFGITDHAVKFVYKEPTHPRYGMQGVRHGFIVKVNDGVVPAAGDDILSVAWYKADEVLSTLTHEDDKELFRKMIGDLMGLEVIISQKQIADKKAKY